jgi:hypothetical protein
MKIEIDTPDPPEGWVVEGFRRANKGERWWDGGGWQDCEYSTSGHYLVAVKAKPKWRKATAADEGKQARVKDIDGTCAACKLLHVDNHDTLMPYLVMLKGSTSVGWFKVCEVLHES